MRRKNKAIWTVVDLWIGLSIYFLFFEIIGLIFVENRIPYTIGLLFGCITAAFLAWNMFVSIDQALDMSEQDAIKYTKRKSIVRALVMLVVAFVGMRVFWISFPGVIIGILGLKISAFLQPYTNSHITKKIFKKGR